MIINIKMKPHRWRDLHEDEASINHWIRPRATSAQRDQGNRWNCRDDRLHDQGPFHVTHIVCHIGNGDD